jgi:hypothetical protein
MIRCDQLNLRSQARLRVASLARPAPLPLTNGHSAASRSLRGLRSRQFLTHSVDALGNLVRKRPSLLAPSWKMEFARGILDGGDEALRTSAFPAFINVVHETRLARLSTSKAHRPIAFLANGLFGKRSWRGDGPFHHRALR